MKILKKVRLINWHRFHNETIEFGRSVLLSGENGAGKSTLLDAIQFVVTCSKVNFNKAAHEKGKRNLNSYMRCKTGREDHPYQRTGAISSHIALEFYDEPKKKSFIVGVVMDSATEDKEPNVFWYLMENRQLKEEYFWKGDQPRSISSFRSANSKDIRSYAQTIQEAKKMMLARFGRLEEKFFSLVPKALAFKPIHDIKDFVYSYVLDEKSVNIDLLRENVRTYQELERILEDVRTRIRELEQIISLEHEVEACIRRDRIQEYYITRSSVEITDDAIHRMTQKIRREELKRTEWEQRKKAFSDERDAKEQLIRDLTVELNSDSDYQALRELERQENALKEQLIADKAEMKELKNAVKKALSNTETLLAFPDVDPSVQEYHDYLQSLEECASLVDLSLCLEHVIAWKTDMYRRIQEKLAEVRVDIKTQKIQLNELDHKIQELQARRLIYPSMPVELQKRIREQFQQTGRSGEPRILCELLEITNPAWQNAVEGYLNTQRFYLLVEPEDFDLALSVYDRMREKKKVYGVGLINTGKLEEYDEIPSGSLAEVVSSKNLWARRYINMTLGKVHRCASYQELKMHSVAITRQCMRYQNHVVSAIRPEIYKTPYIGSEAYKIQLAQCERDRKELTELLTQKEEHCRQLERAAACLTTAADVDVKYRLKALESLRLHQSQLDKCRMAMKEMKVNQTIIQKQLQLMSLKKQKAELENKVQQAASQGGICQGHIEEYKNSMEALKQQHKSEVDLLIQVENALGNELPLCEKEYDRNVRERNGDHMKVRENFERARKANATTRENKEKDLTAAMRDYKVAHDFGAAETLLGYPEFEQEHQRLKNSQLLEYEEKVITAKEAAEAEFREQFLARLQENIKQAQTEFRALNKALSDIHFSREQYEFRYQPSRALGKYYRMIMDDFNILEGESIFSGLFNAQHKEVIDELFEKLTMDDENSQRILEEYTDYRTYMDYDIQITNEDGSYMFYSKVSREKSGGETQTPFYITVAASFMQLYRNSIGGDAIGLIMMDEAFNNMDDERIRGVLSFLTKNSNLQTVIAAPPDKIQYIGPSMEKILLVLQDGESSYVEDFTHSIEG